jgi:inner membrane protein
VLAANAPDIDIFAMFAGSYAGLAFRRGWTHGPIALVLLPLALTGLMLAWDRWVRRRGERGTTRAPLDARATLLIAFIGVVSHPALDWLNTYGIRLLMPFSGKWFYGDAVFIIDPWLWLLLAAALVPWRRTRGRVRVFGGLAAVYVAAMIGGSVAAESMARRAAEGAGITGIEEVMYQPAPAQPHRGSVIVATGEAYTLGDFEWLAPASRRVTFGPGTILRGDWTTRVVREAMTDPRARDYLTWSRFPFVRVEVTVGEPVVFFGDARFVDGRAGSLQGVRVVPGEE